MVDRGLTGGYSGGPPRFALPFSPKSILVAYDPTRGDNARVVPRMKQMLEDRGFAVTAEPMGEGEVIVEDYDGVVIGTTTALRGGGASALALDWVGRAQGLEEKKVAVFSTFWVTPGQAGERLKNRVLETGAEVVVDYTYWLVRPREGEHFLPAECMVRMR